MRIYICLLIAAIFSSSLAFADSAANVDPLPIADFKKIAGERSVSIDATTRTVILEFAKIIETPNPQIVSLVNALNDNVESISLVTLMALLDPRQGQGVSKQLTKHSDPVVRFVAGIVLSGSGDSDAANSVHTLIHDESLEPMDKRLIRTWCDGVGIRVETDDADTIFSHLSTAMGGEPKLKKGDEAPAFEAETSTGQKLSLGQLKGRVVVLHFWATSCGPCMANMPSHISALSKYDSENVEVVFVSLDEDKDAYNAAVEKNEIPFKSVRDARGWGGDLARAFGVNLMPFDIVIDRDGIIFSNSTNDIDAALKTESTAR
ncbi:Thiol-disulfide oxidoreductase ResA [Allorhodopirellula heiligendammensis]|uniref:Thiol-disulfide oxidoreductase ResA n=2 Tax=Allorhodopirellula heiligendammensis TaxID=2714739 RepID=A0A5C6BY90_9BACT|nr:Thiol-disulfide oxidoreductase ResA [Allorhodopirellula heiligendammensis]